MHRPLIYTGEIPLDTDFLRLARSTMVGLGMALQAVLGTATLVDGLACNPTAPASMQVSLGPGSIMGVGSVDATAYGALAADTTNQILKQGIQLGSQLLTLTAPPTSGYSQNYLVVAAFAETDTTPVVLPYYNSANPASPLLGPGGTGQAQNTIREGDVVIQLVAGVAAPSGSQADPAAPNGTTPLYRITVQNGQTTITSGNISQVAGAPFIKYKLPQLSPVTGALLASNNLSDLGNLATALSNLGFGASLGASSGYYKTASGLIVQYGFISSVAADNTAIVTFPLQFPNAFYGGHATIASNAIVANGNYSAYAFGGSTTGMTVANDGNTATPAPQAIFWTAYGK